MKLAGLILAAALALAGAAQARPFTPRDLAMLARVNDTQIYPDGRFLAYGLRSTDWAGNHGLGSIWILDRRTPSLPARPLAISEKAATPPPWGADGRSLYFLSARTGIQQVWRTDADGAVAAQVTSLPINVGSYRF